jgi:hypothetical protein
MNPRDIFQKLKSFVGEVLQSEAFNPEQAGKAQSEAKKTEELKIILLQTLFAEFPEQMNKIFWDIANEHGTWGKPREWTAEDIIKIVQKHILTKSRSAKNHTYSTMLCQVADYWVVSDITGMEENISSTMINMKVIDTLEIIPGINTISKLQKEDESKPGLVVYYFSTSNQVIFPYFHFVE